MVFNFNFIKISIHLIFDIILSKSLEKYCDIDYDIKFKIVY